MSNFDIILKTSSSLHPDGEPDRFISEHAGVIRRSRDRGGKTINVGVARAHDLFAALFDSGTDDIREDVRAAFDVFDADILVLDHVLLSPRWRGLKLGLMAARKMIDLLGGARVPARWIPRHAEVDEEREARRKLRRHFRRMGFRRIGRTRYDALSLSQVTPTLEDIVRPGR